ncbi:hypothetical protein [Plebeiibacterium marinum]|uniref:DUF4382 domain-containing protein n=1 Tax=Plebeiibacterium marinum TaxID=2992111 RepID=A0AAE3MG85_9BACT|nr:hypothetical protein [Plebeiobacterium marinum]MCW3807021.1 hypothetical protein [Plebeiobacterium marinum]
MKRSFIILSGALLLFSCTLTETKTEISTKSLSELAMLKSITYVAEAGDSVLKITSFLNEFNEKEMANLAMVSFNGVWIAIDNLKDVAKLIDLELKFKDLKGQSSFVNQHLEVYVPKGSKTVFIPEMLEDKDCDYKNPSFVLEGNTPIEGAEKSTVQLSLIFDGDHIVDQEAIIIN